MILRKLYQICLRVVLNKNAKLNSFRWTKKWICKNLLLNKLKSQISRKYVNRSKYRAKMVNATFVFTRSKFVQIHFFVPCFSDHFCEYSFKHERPHSVPSRSFSILIYTVIIFSLLLQPNVDILCQNSPRTISPKTVTKEMGSSIWNKET